MRVRLACPIVLVLAGVVQAAPAELAVGEIALELQPTHDFLADEGQQSDDLPLVDGVHDAYFRYAGFAQLTGGGHGYGDVGAGAAMATAGLGCSFLAGRAQGRLHFDSSYAGEAHYSICVSRVLLTVAFDGRRGVGLEPAFDARRSLWAQRYDDSYDRIEVGFGELYWDPKHRHTFLPIGFGHGTLEQGDRKVVTMDMDFAFYRYRRVGKAVTLTVDAVKAEVAALKAGADNNGGIGTTITPARIRVETPERYLAVGAGWGLSGGQFTASSKTEVNGEVTSEWTDTINTEGLPQIAMFAGDVEVGEQYDRVEWSAKLSRSFYPTFDGNVAREARLAGIVSYVAGRTRRTKLSLSPFAARTRTWTRDAGTSLDLSAGASLYFGRELTRELRVDAIGQAGVSPYAKLDAAGVPASTLGGQVLVALSARVTDLHNLHRNLTR